MKKKIVHPSTQQINPSSHWIVSNSYVMPNGKTLEKDEIIRIDGEQGMRFMFLQHVVNPANDKEWIDVNEIHKGALGMFRSFRPDRIRPVAAKKKPRVYRKKA
jgi:hypothetical protein